MRVCPYLKTPSIRGRGSIETKVSLTKRRECKPLITCLEWYDEWRGTDTLGLRERRCKTTSPKPYLCRTLILAIFDIFSSYNRLPDFISGEGEADVACGDLSITTQILCLAGRCSFFHMDIPDASVLSCDLSTWFDGITCSPRWRQVMECQSS